MADYRFKIQGNANPFLIQLSGGSPSTFICSKTFEYSGNSSGLDPNTLYTCAILSNLEPETDYQIKVTDCVGRSHSIPSFTTDAAPEPFVLPTIDYGMLGEPYDPSNGSQCIEAINEPKYIQFSPPLSGDQCVDIKLSGYSQYDTTNTTATAILKVYKSCNGGAWERILCLDNSNGETSCITIKPNDLICYELSAFIDDDGSGTVEYTTDAASCLKISEISGSTVNLNHDINIGPESLGVSQSYSYTTTTTTTTEQAPINVYWAQPLIGGDGETVSLTSILQTDPALNSDQVFRLCFYNEGFWCFDNYLDRPICGDVCAIKEPDSNIIPNTTVSVVSETLNGPRSCIQIADTGYVDVNCDDIKNGNIRACVIAKSSFYNDNLAHMVCARTRINQVEARYGGGTYNTPATYNNGVREFSICKCISTTDSELDSGGTIEEDFGTQE